MAEFVAAMVRCSGTIQPRTEMRRAPAGYLVRRPDRCCRQSFRRVSLHWLARSIGLVAAVLILAATAPAASAQGREGKAWPLHHIAGEGVPSDADGHCIADVDGDGLPDIVVAHDLPEPRGAISIHFHPGTEAVRQPWPSLILSGMHTTEGARAADLDGDGRPEVIAANQSAPFTLWFPPEDARQLRVPDLWQRVDLPDHLGHALEVQTFQLDGRYGPDVVAGRDDLWWMATPSDPRDPTAWTRYPISGAELGPKAKVKTILFADMDADGDSDVFITSTVGTYWYENEGLSRDPTEPWTSHKIDPNKLNFGALRDLDGDGLEDVVVGNDAAGSEGGFLRWLKRMHPTQNEWKTFDLPVPPRIKIKSAAIMDVDGDGSRDIVLGGTSPKPGFSTAIWLRATGQPGDPDTRWIDHEIRPGGAKSDYIVPFDLDDDGDIDITFTNEGTDNIHWLENRISR